VALAVLVVFFVVRSKGWRAEGGRPKAEGGRQKTEGTEQTAAPSANPQSAIMSPPALTGGRNPQLDVSAAWPMFHGSPGLLGRADGDLADSFTLRWKFKTGAEVKSSAAIQGGRLFIGSSDENIYALDLSTGGKLWSHKTAGAVEAAPCVLDGRVVVGSTDGFLYALDAVTGDLKWKYETGGQILGAANWTPAPDGRATWVLVGSYDNKLHCLEAQSGRLIWSVETDNYINGAPAVADGQCVFGGCDALIHVVSVADGVKVTQIDSGSYIAASAAFHGGEIYVGNYGNVFLKADLQSGRIVWQYTQSDAPFFSSPALGAQCVVVGGRDQHVHCLRRDTGEKVWTFKTLGEVNSSPALCGDKVVVGSDDGRLYVLTLADGKLLWSYEMGQPVTSSPAVAGGVIVIGCDDGYVYAFGPNAASGGKIP